MDYHRGGGVEHSKLHDSKRSTFHNNCITSASIFPGRAVIGLHVCGVSALAAAAAAGIRHGDIRPENVIRVSNGSRHPYFVLIGWGHAILEDRDRPVMNLFFSSTFALQEGKLCAASDAESLIYLLYFSCGGVCPELDSAELPFILGIGDQDVVTTMDYSQLIFSPICSDACTLADLRKLIRSEHKEIRKCARAVALDIMDK